MFSEKVEDLLGKLIQAFFEWVTKYAGAIIIYIVGAAIIVSIALHWKPLSKERKISSVTSSFNESQKELQCLKQDMKDVKRRLREVEWIIDEKVGNVVFSIAHSPIKELKLPDNSAIVPPIK